MTKYSTDSRGDGTEEQQSTISVNVNDWIKDALSQIVRRSQGGTRETIQSIIEYAVIEYYRDFESGEGDIGVSGEHIWDPRFRCINCKSANKFLFRKKQGDDNSPILCLNCNERMSEEEVTRLERAAEIQDMDPYTLEKEGTKIKHKYEGHFRSPMRFECQECKERDLILPNLNKIDVLICPRCGNKGGILEQIKGPVVKGFKKYPPDRYYSEPTPDQIGRGVSRGNYDDLEKAYQDSYER